MPEQQQVQPPQEQKRRAGLESEITPKPKADYSQYKGSDKLRDLLVPLSGGDSGIGRAVAIACAKEGAKIAIVYLN
jgi:hypothetical protein